MYYHSTMASSGRSINLSETTIRNYSLSNLISCSPTHTFLTQDPSIATWPFSSMQINSLSRFSLLPLLKGFRFGPRKELLILYILLLYLLFLHSTPSQFDRRIFLLLFFLSLRRKKTRRINQMLFFIQSTIIGILFFLLNRVTSLEWPLQMFRVTLSLFSFSVKFFFILIYLFLFQSVVSLDCLLFFCIFFKT